MGATNFRTARRPRKFRPTRVSNRKGRRKFRPTTSAGTRTQEHYGQYCRKCGEQHAPAKLKQWSTLHCQRMQHAPEGPAGFDPHQRMLRRLASSTVTSLHVTRMLGRLVRECWGAFTLAVASSTVAAYSDDSFFIERVHAQAVAVVRISTKEATLTGPWGKMQKISGEGADIQESHKFAERETKSD